MRSRTVQFALVNILGLVSSGSATDLPHLPMKVEGFADAGLLLVGPSDPRFNGMANAVLQGRSDPSYEILKPYSVILQNNSTKTLVAYAISWDCVEPDGTVTGLDKSVMQVSALLDGDRPQTDPEEKGQIQQAEFAVGKRTDSENLFADNGAIEPGDFKIVTVESGLESLIGTKRPALREAFDGQRAFDLQLKIHGYDEDKAISVTLDGAFFEDGSFIGPDQSKFFDEFRAEVSARQNVMAYIVNNASEGLDQVAAELQLMVSVDKFGFIHPLGLGASSDLSKFRKSRYAAAFLNIRKKRGDEAALGWAKRQLFRNPPPFLSSS
jgi:hypothetical protein